MQTSYVTGACPGGGLEIEKQKKVIRANFKLFHLYFATFLVGNIIFSAIFRALLKNWKKSLSDFCLPPPLRIL